LSFKGDDINDERRNHNHSLPNSKGKIKKEGIENDK